jgi:hypothetical protein
VQPARRAARTGHADRGADGAAFDEAVQNVGAGVASRRFMM